MCYFILNSLFICSVSEFHTHSINCYFGGEGVAYILAVNVLLHFILSDHQYLFSNKNMGKI